VINRMKVVLPAPLAPRSPNDSPGSMLRLTQRSLRCRAVADYHPATGSCPRCEAALGLASVKEEGSWYCSPACAQGRPRAEPDAPAVPDHWLYPRPKRFLRRRRPKELKSTRPGT
jgi:hypothetical protein